MALKPVCQLLCAVFSAAAKLSSQYPGMGTCHKGLMLKLQGPGPFSPLVYFREHVSLHTHMHTDMQASSVAASPYRCLYTHQGKAKGTCFGQ